jgi:peptidyl-tRNA hydrolase, PTH2 family
MVALLKSLFSSHSLKMALIVRVDLKLSKGKTASQCAHAAVMCYQNSLKQAPKLLQQWSRQGQPKIVLKVDTLEELLQIQSDAAQKGIVTGLVADAGRTQISAGTYTVVGLGPEISEKLDLVIKHLKLL